MRKFIVYLFLIGLALRIIAVFYVKNYYKPRDYEYGEIARNIVNGNGFSRSVFSEEGTYLTSSHAPVYPYFLAFFYKFGNKPFVFIIIQIIQAIISAITIVIIYGIAGIIFNRKVANISAVGFTFYPLLIYYSTKLVPTTFSIFFLSLSIFLIMKSRKSVLLSVSCGTILGLSILCDPIKFMVILPLIIWYIFIKKYELREPVIILSIAVLILIPWTVRNYIVHHHFVPVTSQFGFNFWLGNNPNATGTAYFKVNPDSSDYYISMLQTLPENIQDSLSKIDEIARSRYFLKEGVNFIRNEPFKYLNLLIKKTYYYWWFKPPDIFVSKDMEKYGILLKIFYPIILFPGIIGLILSRKFIRDTSLMIMIMFFISSLYIIANVGLIRYRAILEPYLIIFASFCLCSLNIRNRIRFFFGRHRRDSL